MSAERDPGFTAVAIQVVCRWYVVEGAWFEKTFVCDWERLQRLVDYVVDVAALSKKITHTFERWNYCEWTV